MLITGFKDWFVYYTTLLENTSGIRDTRLFMLGGAAIFGKAVYVCVCVCMCMYVYV